MKSCDESTGTLACHRYGVRRAAAYSFPIPLNLAGITWPALPGRLWRRLQLALDRRRYRAFRDLRSRWYADFWQQAAASCGATADELGDGFLRIRRGGRDTIVRGPHVRLDDHLALEIAGHRPLVFRMLADWGHRIPRHAEFTRADPSPAAELMARCGAIVVKPARGTGGGQGVTTCVESPRSLRQAIRAAAVHDDRLMAESQVPGASYRLLYLDGELIDAVRRDPPALRGDGEHAIAALMKAENERRLSGATVSSLNPLRPDLDCRLTLRRQGHTLRDVVPAGEVVCPKTVVNENTTLENHVVTDQVHETTIEAGRDIARRLNLALMGLDLICEDVGRPLAESGVINEINTTPGLHHHLLVAARDQPLALGERLIERLLG